jgi:23S rRNA pseudoU1915 N3-methylase RlmH
MCRYSLVAVSVVLLLLLVAVPSQQLLPCAAYWSFGSHPHTARLVRQWRRSTASVRPHRTQTQCLLHMGMKVTIRIVGRKQGGEGWIDDGCSMYLTRLQPSGLEVGTEWHRNDAALVKSVQGDYDKNTPVVLLDPTGTKRTSETLANSMYQWLEDGGSRLVFVIGGGQCGRTNRAKALFSQCKYNLTFSFLIFFHF